MKTTPKQKSEFLLLLHQPGGGTPPPEELKKIMAKFHTWMADVRAKHSPVSTNGLAPAGKVLRGPNGLDEIDGPYAEGKEIVGGYVLITANSLEEAIAAGRGCPGLALGMAVEVRPVLPHE